VISGALTKDFSLNLASRYLWVMADSSFDVVSKVDRMELDNALNQAAREVATRFDFKNTGVKIEMSGEKILVEAETEERVKAALDVLKEKMIKRNVSLKHLDIAEPMQSGKVYRIFASIKEGISQENAKKITKLLKDEGPKSVRTQIQGDELRVSSKSRDDLQAAIALIKGAKLDFAVQFTNYR
jgi:uncharacterized protein YajQ (UPF0234 family)